MEISKEQVISILRVATTSDELSELTQSMNEVYAALVQAKIVDKPEFSPFLSLKTTIDKIQREVV